MTFKELYTGRQVCCTCVHYQQHYYREKRKYYEVFCGHCRAPKLKIRKPSQTCGLWTPIVSGQGEGK